jgi:hypothetical protein
LCVSGAVLGLLKAKIHRSQSNFISTKEEFKVALRGDRKYWFDEEGNSGVEDTIVKIPKGDAIIESGYQEYLQAFDAIVLCDHLPFMSSTSGEFFKIWFQEKTPDDFIQKMKDIFKNPLED